jgi:uncharacterized protein (DUF58 family)
MGNWFKAGIIALAVIFAALASGLDLLFHLAYFLLGIIAIAWLWSWINVTFMTVKRATRTHRSQVGQQFEEHFTVRNTSFIPKLWVEIRDQSNLPDHNLSHVFALPPKAIAQMDVRTLCKRRGIYNIGPCIASTGDPFGIFRYSRLVKGEETVIVYPAMIALPGFDLPTGELPGGHVRRQHSHQMTPMAGGIREYVSGDPQNRIHWLYTARTGHLMTKEFEADPSSDVWIVLDLQRKAQVGVGDDSTEECGVTIAASLAKHFLDLNRAVGLIAFGADHHLVHIDRGARQLIKILECLAAARAQGGMAISEVLAAEEIRFTTGSTLLVISPSVEESWAYVMQDLARRRVRSAAVVLEASTFGSQANSMLVVGAMAAAGIPIYLVKQGDALENVFVGTVNA